MATTVTAEGQVTIPKDVQDFLGIGPGSKIDFRRVEDGSVVLVPANDARPVSKFAGLLGHAGPGLSTDEIMEMTRGEE